MQKNDFSLSSDALIDSSNLEDPHLDSGLLESSDSLTRIPPAPTVKASSDLQHIIFVKLQEISKQNLDAGFIDQALQGYERCSEQLRTLLSGDINSPTYLSFLYENLSYLNESALKYLQVNSTDDAIKILNKCLEIAHPEPYRAHPDLQSLTYNHLGCCYRRLGNLDQALYCLQKALHYHERAIEIGIQGQFMESSSVTHVNFCAILSQKGRHQEALEHAKKAVVDCTRDLLDSRKHNADPTKQAQVKKKATLLAISYYNLGVEEAFCQNQDLALEAYSRAHHIAEEYNGRDDPVTLRFQQALNNIKIKRKSSPPRTSINSAINLPVANTTKAKSRPLRPHSAQTMPPTAASSSRLERLPSPKRCIETNSFAASMSQRLQIRKDHPKILLNNSLRIQSPESLSSTPKVLSRPVSGVSHRKPPKAATPTGNTKLFFPMGGMAPFVEPETFSKTTKAQEAKKIHIPTRPQRPATANSQSKATQGRRISKPTVRPLSPSSIVSPLVSPKESNDERKYNGRNMNRSDFMSNQDEIPEDLDEGRESEIRKGTLENYTKFKDFMNPITYNSKQQNPTSHGNESTKWTSAGFDVSEDHAFSFRRASAGNFYVNKFGDVDIKEDKTKSSSVRDSQIKHVKLALDVQAHWRGYCCRKKYNRLYRGLNPIQFWAVPCKIMRRPLERADHVDEYLVVMTYSRNERILYVNVKNMHSKAFYKGRVGYVLEKRELGDVCSNLLKTIGIDFGRLHFQAKSQMEEVIKDEVIEKISEKSEESDVGPLIEALEKEADVFLEEEIEKDGVGESPQKSSHGVVEENKSGFERLETIETQDEALRHDDTTKFRLESQPSNSKSEMGSPGGNLNEDESSSHKKFSQRVNLLKAEQSYSEIEEINGKESRYILFSKRVIIKGQVVTLRLESSKVSNQKLRLFLSCYGTSKPQRIEIIELPSSLAEKKNPSVEDVIDIINVDFNPLKLSLRHQRPPYDSFSSYNDASIALDLSGNNTEGPVILRSESLRKQTSPEDRLSSPEEKQHQRLFRGFSSSMLDSRTNNIDRDQTQYLGLGKWKSKGEEQKRSAFGNKVFEASTGREQSSQERSTELARRGKKDSRTTLSQGDFSQRTEAEGSIMLRVAEGVFLFCRVAYKRGDSEVIVKYTTTGEESGFVEEIKINLEELGLDSGEIEKDDLLEKVSNLLGRRLKVKRGELVYERNRLSRQGTIVIKDDDKLSSHMSSRDEIEGKKDREIFLTMKKIEEVEENTRREEISPLQHSVRKSVQNSSGKSLRSADNKIDSRRTIDSAAKIGSGSKLEVDTKNSAELKPTKQLSSGSSHIKDKPEIRIRLEDHIDSATKDASFGNQQDTSILSSNRSDRVTSSPNKISERLIESNTRGGFIETFGVLHSSEESCVIERSVRRKHTEIKINILESSNHFVKSNNPVHTIQLPQSKNDDCLGSPRNLGIKKQNNTKDTLSPKIPLSKGLKPPEPRRVEDSSPKVKNNLTLKTNPLVRIIGADTDEEMGSSGVWSFAVNGSEHMSPQLDPFEKDDSSTSARARDLKNGFRNYAGDIPKIVIHRELESGLTNDSKYFSKSLGNLDYKALKHKKVKTAAPKVYSMAFNDNDDDDDENGNTSKGGKKEWGTDREEPNKIERRSSSRKTTMRPIIETQARIEQNEKLREETEGFSKPSLGRLNGDEKKKTVK